MRIHPALLCACLPLSVACQAAGPFDFYVGAGVGEATLRQDAYQVDAHATGWKALAGWRPLDAFGVEGAYEDLGSKHVSYVDGANSTNVSTDAHATALFGVGYLPVPLPLLDLYAKAGIARVADHTHVSFGCAGGAPCAAPLTEDDTRTSFAWGAGVQVRFGLPAVRLDYERFSGSHGDDALLSLALVASF